MTNMLEGKRYIVTDEHGRRWAVPVMTIARSRAKHYAHEYEGDLVRSLTEDTLPLFEHDFFEIRDWASNNMDWSDVAGIAVQLTDSTVDPDMQEAWVNGEWEID